MLGFHKPFERGNKTHWVRARPVPEYLEKLRLFCILYDYQYERIERYVRSRLEQTLIGKVHSRIEHAQAHLVRKVNSQGTIGKAV